MWHDARHVKHAMRHMAREVQDDIRHNMEDQKKNAIHIYKDFLNEARERYVAWGCNEKCTDEATRLGGNLMDMEKCDCPADITVSGDTSIIMQ